MRRLGRFIVHQQYDDGHFRSNADLEREAGTKLKREVIYYPGEAVLGLMRLYALDPQPEYLDAARKGADWVVHVRDAYVSEENQEHDHWMSYALNELYRVTRDEAYSSSHAGQDQSAPYRENSTVPKAPPHPIGRGPFTRDRRHPRRRAWKPMTPTSRLHEFAGKPRGGFSIRRRRLRVRSWPNSSTRTTTSG